MTAIRTHCPGVLAQGLKRILPCTFTQIYIDANVSADERLQRSANIANDAAGTHDDATNQPNMPRNAVTIETQTSRA